MTKYKYRIVTNDSEWYPFKIQYRAKGFIGLLDRWSSFEICKSLEEAREKIMKHKAPKTIKVIETYE